MMNAILDKKFLLILREWRFLTRYKSLFIAVVGYPLIVLLLFLYLFQAEVVQKMPISVVDLDQTTLSRELVQTLSATPEILVAKRDMTLYDARQRLLNGDVYGIVLIPNQFEKDVLNYRSPEVVGFYNNQYMSVGSTLNTGFSNSFSGLMTRIQTEILTAKGLDNSQAVTTLNPIKVDVRALFNPTLNYIFTLVNGLFPCLLQILMMMSMSASTVQDKNRLGGFLPSLRLARFSISTWILSKISIYTMLFFSSLIIFDGFLSIFYDIPLRGNIFMLGINSLMFVVSSLLMGMAIAIWMPNSAMSYGVVSIFSSPAFGFTGLFFPKIAMGTFAYVWGICLPITWYIEARLNETLRGESGFDSMISLVGMAIIASIAFILIYIKLSLVKKEPLK